MSRTLSFRSFVIITLPWIKSLDFVCVTPDMKVTLDIVPPIMTIILYFLPLAACLLSPPFCRSPLAMCFRSTVCPCPSVLFPPFNHVLPFASCPVFRPLPFAFVTPFIQTAFCLFPPASRYQLPASCLSFRASSRLGSGHKGADDLCFHT